MGRTSKYVVPTARTKAIMKEATGFNISVDAAESVSEAASEYVRSIAHQASLAAQHAGRKTVQLRDVQYVLTVAAKEE